MGDPYRTVVLGADGFRDATAEEIPAELGVLTDDLSRMEPLGWGTGLEFVFHPDGTYEVRGLHTFGARDAAQE